MIREGKNALGAYRKGFLREYHSSQEPKSKKEWDEGIGIGEKCVPGK